ncbi:hypothetical protein [Phytohabitans flavus]|nr:hypothetical protein [Phytohabitans flavus]
MPFELGPRAVEAEVGVADDRVRDPGVLGGHLGQPDGLGHRVG